MILIVPASAISTILQLSSVAQGVELGLIDTSQPRISRSGCIAQFKIAS